MASSPSAIGSINSRTTRLAGFPYSSSATCRYLPCVFALFQVQWLEPKFSSWLGSSYSETCGQTGSR